MNKDQLEKMFGFKGSSINDSEPVDYQELYWREKQAKEHIQAQYSKAVVVIKSLRKQLDSLSQNTDNEK